MKISNKREPQEIVINHSSDIDFRNFANILKKMQSKAIVFLIS